jgi:hypothetical protein
MRLSDQRLAQTRRGLYQDWAIALESLFEAGQIPIVEKNEICSFIINAIKRQGADIFECKYAADCLPPQYKRTYELSSTYPSKAGNLPVVESSIVVENVFSVIQWLEHLDPGHLTRKDHQNLYDGYNKLLHRQKEACADRHIIVMDEFDEGWNPPKSPFDDAIHMESPEEAETIFSQQADAFAADAASFAQTTKTNPPRRLDDGQLDKEFYIRGAKALYAWRCLIRPSIDRKWRSSWLMWRQHIEDTLNHGLHAAMSLSKLETKLLGTFRGVTREQIDAKVLVCLRYFEQFATDMPGAIEVFEYFERFQAPYRRHLSVKLHDKLSHES